MIAETPSDIIRVVITDDSAVVRGLLTRVLETDPKIRVVAAASNGEQAIAAAQKFTPDILILDIEMPVMDGITALPHIIAASPGTKVIMCSTLSLRNADITLQAMEKGAADAIAKPTSAGNILSSESQFKETLIHMVKNIGVKKNRPANTPSASAAPKTAPEKSTGPKPILYGTNHTVKLLDLKTAYSGKPSIVVIGSSTGGPPALFSVLAACKDLNVPIIITQHMPPTFTAMLASHIETRTGVPAAEGKDGEALRPGRAYIAPGGFHMVVKSENGVPTIRLNTDPPENFCRPAVDPMLRSAIEVFGNRILAVILTGMGSDGFRSAKDLIAAGGRLFAQDEASSVVWGMPGAVATGGLCHVVAPLDELGPLIRRTVMGH